jgi:hypothetical protein
VEHSQQGLLQFASFQSQQSTGPMRQEISSSALRNRSRAVSKLSIRSSSSAEKLLIDINPCIVGLTGQSPPVQVIGDIVDTRAYRVAPHQSGINLFLADGNDLNPE